ARYLAELIEAEPGLELMAPVPLTAVCFRIQDATEADHAAVLARLAEEGTAFLIPARIDGQPGIRACVTNYRTTHADIDLILARLSDIARQLSLRDLRRAPRRMAARLTGQNGHQSSRNSLRSKSCALKAGP